MGILALALWSFGLGSVELFAQDKVQDKKKAKLLKKKRIRKELNRLRKERERERQRESQSAEPEISEKVAEIEEETEEEMPKTWVFDRSYRLLGTYTASEIIKEKTNPDNAVYQLPTSSYLTEFRPELIGSFDSNYKLVLRPRAYAQVDNRKEETDLYKRNETESKFFVNEAYFAVSPSEEWQVVLGTQNYQWGPAELASPSNAFFRDFGLDKTYFFETRGRAMVRVNYSPTAQLNVVIMGEPTDNGADRPQFDRKFHKQVLAKVEYSDASQTNYIGLTATTAEADRPQFGSYGNYEIATAFTAYYDLSNRVGSKTFYPLIDASGADFRQTLYDDDTRYTTAVIGFRYVTERAWDIRLEAFNDQLGWTQKDREDALLVFFNNPDARKVNLYLAPGSFFPGREFLYASIRIPDWGWKDSLTFSLRNFHSLADNTGKLQATLDTFLNDHLVASTGVTYSTGPEDGQLTQGFLWQSYLSAAWIF